MALQAGVPLALAYFDYRGKRIGVESFLRLGGDRAADLAEIAEIYRRTAHGRRPADAAPIVFKG